MDLATVVPHFPRPGETLQGNRFLVAPGGKGGNQAIAAARLGANVALIACVGNDEFGPRLLASLQAEGIDCSGVVTSEHAASGIAMVVVDHTGNNSIVTVQGSNGDLTPQQVARHVDSLATARMIVCDLTVPVATVESVLSTARQSGIPVLLNASPVQSPEPARLLPQIRYLVVNEVEAATLSARPVDSIDDAKAVASALHDAGATHVLVTLGARGVVAHFETDHGAQVAFFPASPVTAVDTTGAGDTFAGAFATAIVGGASGPRAIAFAQAAAATCVTRAGAAPSIPYLHEIGIDFRSN
ncbi:ribokinase [Paraburkholderia rhizosphaerae]|uniref:Deoxyribokinase n=2 Tax=Paraburkholderia rhizosphaerae TaxID=480658 RepID=A0A4R8LX77_9BURK|nr:ribokinase [Paraburkholderia rhizosphaerae]